jgi:predicted HTH domain antitoxin
MTDSQIIDLFDSTNITLAELSRRSGRDVEYLKNLLMRRQAYP